MKLIRNAADLQPGARKVSVAIGVFDGVHLGHQQVIRQAITDARQHEGAAVAITFDRHPNAVVAPDRTPPLIYSLTQKLRAIESLGMDATWLIAFDKEFSEKPAEAFIRQLARGLAPIHSICVGSTFTFGHRRGGNVELLKRLGGDLKFAVHGLAAVALDGKPVSSTRIRESIRTGDLDAATQMLGREYSLAGAVIRGDELGRRLGFPTANLDVRGIVVPPSGVYAVHAFAHGVPRRAVVNIGFRPTVASQQPELRVEVHLLDFEGDLYGEELEIRFVEKLRDEQKFESLDALREQIARDIRTARDLFER